MKSKQITFLSLIFVAYPVRAHNFIISIPHSPRKESGKFNFSSLYICGFFVYNILANLIWNAKGIFVMSMLEFEEYKGKLNTLKPEWIRQAIAEKREREDKEKAYSLD